MILLGFPLVSLAQKPELLIQTGQVNIDSIAFSLDGKFLATSNGRFRQIKLWEVATGRELRTLTLPPGTRIGPSAFVKGSHTLATVITIILKRNYLNFWNIDDGSVTTADLRPAGGFVLNSGGTLLGGLTVGGIKIWDLNTRVVHRSFEADRVALLALSGDGKTLAARLSFPNQDSIRVLNVESGTVIRTVKEDNEVTTFSLSRDGGVLASVTIEGRLKLWDVNSGAVLRTFRRKPDCLAFNSEGNILAVGESQGALQSWGGIALIDLATGNDLSELKAQTERVSSLGFSSDGRLLASGTQFRNVKLWTLTSGGTFQTLGRSEGPVNSVVFSPDSRLLAAGGTDVRLWNVNSGAGVQRIELSDTVSVLALSNDGGKLAVKGGDGTIIELYDAKTGIRLRSLSGHSDVITAIAFNPDGLSIASASKDGTIRFWDPSTGVQQRLLKANVKAVQAIAFSPNGKLLASGGDSKSIKLWDPNTGAQLRTLIGRAEYVYGLAFSQDGTMLVSKADGLSTSERGMVELWSIDSAALMRTFKIEAEDVAFSADARVLATSQADGAIRLWDIPTGTELASLIAVGAKDWLVVKPDGLFDGSSAAWSKIFWRFSQNLYDIAPVEIFFNEFYYPDLLADLLAGKRPHAVTDISKIDRHQPGLKFALLSGLPSMNEITTRDMQVKIEVTDGSAGAKDVRLFRNGSLVKVWHGDVLRGQSQVVLELTLPLIAGENRLTAYAFNKDNIKSSDATITITRAEKLRRKGVAYVLGVGVNVYANSEYNLKYAVADAKDFSEEFKRQQSRLANYDKVELIALHDTDATKANILNALAELRAKIRPEDAVVIFFAGHGTAQQNRFYLLPHDLGYTGSRIGLEKEGLQSILAHSLSDEELANAVEGIDAGQMILIIDACNSGQALEAEEKRRGPMNSKGLAQLAYEKGMYILTAAQSYQAAIEAERYGHGFLTYALVEEGLKTGVADREPKDGQVLLREWLGFAESRVPQLQQEELEQQNKQGRQLQRVKLAEPGALNARGPQHPRVFYRRDAESHPLVVAKP